MEKYLGMFGVGAAILSLCLVRCSEVPSVVNDESSTADVLETVLSSESSDAISMSERELSVDAHDNYSSDESSNDQNLSSMEEPTEPESSEVHVSSANDEGDSSVNIGEAGLLREENREREKLSGSELLSTDDWRDSTRFVFHPDSVYTYEIIIDEADLAFLDADPQLEEYVPAAIIFNGEQVDDVLVRYKGSKGAWSPCAEKGPKSCNLSTKVKFNTDTHPDRLFYGLKKLQFHSMNQSESRLAERFAYWSYREMDVAASRTAHVRLLVNGELEGLFLVVEQIDSRFTRYHLNDDKGNVYKHYWPNLEGELSNTNYLDSTLKTNEEEADHTVITRFENEIMDAGSSEQKLKEVLEQWEMTEIIARQVVTANAVLDWDGPYMGAWDTGHNTYWAVLPETEKVIMIPWDMDMPEMPGFMRGMVTSGTLWMNEGFPECPDETTSLFTKSWFCFPKAYAEPLDDLETQVFSKRDEMLSKWTEMIRPVMEEITETFPTSAGKDWYDPKGYPQVAQTIPAWENSIEVYRSMLDGQEGQLDDMKNSFGM